MDTQFSTQVIQNCHRYRTMQELASSLNYTVSGFEKRFKKVFGVSAYQWMKQQKSRLILKEITESGKTFKNISEGFGFATPAHFNNFCKQNLGHTPGKIRQNRMIGGNWMNKGM